MVSYIAIAVERASTSCRIRWRCIIARIMKAVDEVKGTGLTGFESIAGAREWINKNIGFAQSAMAGDGVCRSCGKAGSYLAYGLLHSYWGDAI
jgi:hypothetical protein